MEGAAEGGGGEDPREASLAARAAALVLHGACAYGLSARDVCAAAAACSELRSAARDAAGVAAAEAIGRSPSTARGLQLEEAMRLAAVCRCVRSFRMWADATPVARRFSFAAGDSYRDGGALASAWTLAACREHCVAAMPAWFGPSAAGGPASGARALSSPAALRNARAFGALLCAGVEHYAGGRMRAPTGMGIGGFQIYRMFQGRCASLHTQRRDGVCVFPTDDFFEMGVGWLPSRGPWAGQLVLASLALRRYIPPGGSHYRAVHAVRLPQSDPALLRRVRARARARRRREGGDGDGATATEHGTTSGGSAATGFEVAIEALLPLGRCDCLTWDPPPTVDPYEDAVRLFELLFLLDGEEAGVARGAPRALTSPRVSDDVLVRVAAEEGGAGAHDLLLSAPVGHGTAQ